ncbi:DUF1826 domain-containing protein [Vibrio sp. TH_r3]|uniref:DUF1826 domain-containing protein n=1 Tax=Vibrio sp. TH_r3 TaxID=3082084 RepID=UPI002953C622|nr:DUF1826 domain-containing protein [Vibrio sp. TH_r3]MDV7105764.1 DUF1826 domain-containing protein [Vibrio sp. TH_r3]
MGLNLTVESKQYASGTEVLIDSSSQAIKAKPSEHRAKFIGINPTVLTSIYQAQHNISVLQRTLPTDMTRTIQQMLDSGKSLALVETVTPDNTAQWIRDKLSDYACAASLSEDIALIVDMFCCLFDLPKVGLRLTILDRPMCPKFHVDHVPCRLVTTYAGSSTQWLDSNNINRSKLGAGGLGQPDHLSGLFENERAINTMSPGDVALLKGSGWEGNEDNGLVHRSPELDLNERRLLLTLDMV